MFAETPINLHSATQSNPESGFTALFQVVLG